MTATGNLAERRGDEEVGLGTTREDVVPGDEPGQDDTVGDPLGLDLPLHPPFQSPCADERQRRPLVTRSLKRREHRQRILHLLEPSDGDDVERRAVPGTGSAHRALDPLEVGRVLHDAGALPTSRFHSRG